MKKQRGQHKPRNRQDSRAPGRGQIRDGRGDGGFTLIEVVVVIVVLGILVAAVSVNWASFIRHQELRQDAITLHKEIMALKARAIEHGDTAWLTFGVDNNTGRGFYTMQWYVPNQDDDGRTASPPRTVYLNRDVVITAPADDKWSAKITAAPDNFKSFEDGSITIRRGTSGESYSIQKDASSIRPELHHNSGGGT